MTDPFVALDAIAQAELVRRGDATPLQLVEAAIARVERVNPKLNAVITPLFEKARATARDPKLPDGPFRGVPFLLKDMIGYSAGDPYHMGMRALRATKRLELQGRLVPVPDGVETGPEVYHGKPSEKPDGKPREKPTAINQEGSGGLS